ncbi:hypothetical protein F5050DRAFT_1790117 [Lentinula boryana]|uniref:Uncharacterized protein n=1 Tax=Lentinula boryana TaxID=40481 RepID=A0ABQ8Q142_9AGAR|nr:hypothetical protein F5050DRAFT_1790117 [Lentinula boryana]
MRFSIAYFVFGLASVAYAVPINSDGSASLPSLEAHGSNGGVTFEFNSQHAAETNNAINWPVWGAKAQVRVKETAAEKLAKEVVQDLFQALGFLAELKPGSVYGGSYSQAEKRVDFLAQVPGYKSGCSGWAIRKGTTVNGELNGELNGKFKVEKIDEGKKVKQSE